MLIFFAWNNIFQFLLILIDLWSRLDKTSMSNKMVSEKGTNEHLKNNNNDIRTYSYSEAISINQEVKESKTRMQK